MLHCSSCIFEGVFILMFKDPAFIQLRSSWGWASKCVSAQIYCSLSRCCGDCVLSETSRLCSTRVALNLWAGLLFQALPGCRIWGGGGEMCRCKQVWAQFLLKKGCPLVITLQHLWLQRLNNFTSTFSCVVNVRLVIFLKCKENCNSCSWLDQE